jgi:hypothetical protein
VASICSSRFFSRITCCERCGFDHKFGSEDCFSISVSCGRSLSASKILPEFAHLFAQRAVFLFELLIHEDDSTFSPALWPGLKRVSSAPTEIIAHSQANQSP